MRVGLITLMLCAATSVSAGIVPDPVVFIPSVGSDGSRTWSFSIELRAIRKEDRSLSRAERDKKLAGIMVGWQRFCDSGWEITDSAETDKKLTIAGRCL